MSAVIARRPSACHVPVVPLTAPRPAIINGRGEMEIEDRSQPVGPGCAVYIPPDVQHALRCTRAEPLVFVFAFPRDRFDKVAYHFDR